MASKRMFSKTITSSAKFIKMPAETQALYFHLCMNADDDWVCEAFSIMRLIGSTEDSIRILHAKWFVTILNEDLVTLITDRNEHNLIRPDRKVDSIYKNLLLQIVPDIHLLDPKPRADTWKPTWQQVDWQWTDNGPHRLGKDSLDKDSIGEISLDKDNNLKEDKQESKKSIVNKKNRSPWIEIYEYLQSFTWAIDWDLNDCIYLFYKLEKITSVPWTPIEKLKTIVEWMIKTWQSKFYSISSPSKLDKNLSSIVSKLMSESIVKQPKQTARVLD